MKTLNDINMNEEVVIDHIDHAYATKRRLMDLGFVEKGSVVALLESPSKGMRAYLVKGCKIALRGFESEGIYVVLKGEENAV